MIQQVVGNHHSWQVDFFSFTQVPTVHRKDLEEVGIKSHLEVGNWIVDKLKSRLDQNDLAAELELSFTIREHSCHNQ